MYSALIFFLVALVRYSDEFRGTPCRSAIAHIPLIKSFPKGSLPESQKSDDKIVDKRSGYEKFVDAFDAALDTLAKMMRLDTLPDNSKKMLNNPPESLKVSNKKNHYLTISMKRRKVTSNI